MQISISTFLSKKNNNNKWFNRKWDGFACEFNCIIYWNPFIIILFLTVDTTNSTFFSEFFRSPPSHRFRRLFYCFVITNTCSSLDMLSTHERYKSVGCCCSSIHHNVFFIINDWSSNKLKQMAMKMVTLNRKPWIELKFNANNCVWTMCSVRTARVTEFNNNE